MRLRCPRKQDRSWRLYVPSRLGLQAAILALTLSAAACGSDSASNATSDAVDPVATESPGTVEGNSEPSGSDDVQEAALFMSEDCGGEAFDWDRLITAAQEDGVAVTSGPPDTEAREKLPGEFQSRFGVELDYIGGRTSELIAQVSSERQAGQYTVDVVIGGVESLAKGFYDNDWLVELPELVVEGAALDGDHWIIGEPPFKDPEEAYLIALSEYSSPPLVINTDLVDEGEVTGWRDLLDPKWEGRIVADDPRATGGGAADIQMLRDTFGDEFVIELYEGQDVALLTDERQEIDGLAQGKWAVGIAMLISEIETAIQDGLPLKVISPDDAPRMKTAGYGIVGHMADAPNADAGALFVNWLLCPDGNRVWNESLDIVSTREDVEADAPEYVQILPDKEYWDSYAWDFIYEQKEQTREWIDEALADS